MTNTTEAALRADDLVQLRQSAGMKAKELADLLDISPEHLSRMENGEKPISRVMALAVRTILSQPPASSTVAQEDEEPTWPEWASSLLAIIREYTGPCPEDGYEGVDLPEELRTWFEGYRDELIRAGSLSPSSGEPASVGEAGDPWSDDVGAFVDFGFTKVSRNPSDYETALAYRYAILAALSTPTPASVAGEAEDPCPVCGNEVRGHGGYLQCECPAPASPPSQELGRFGHHPEAAIDYECEIDALIGMAYDRLTGMQTHADLEDRIRKAMEFRVLSTPGELRWLSKHFNGTREIYAVMPECIEKIADRVGIVSAEPASPPPVGEQGAVATCICGDEDCRLWLEHGYADSPATPQSQDEGLREALAKIAAFQPKDDFSGSRNHYAKGWNAACAWASGIARAVLSTPATTTEGGRG